MHLFVCGKTHLTALQQDLPCERRMKIFSNHCKHVPGQRVAVGGEEEVCPLTVLSPMHVLGAAGEPITIQATCAQNVIMLGQKDSFSSPDVAIKNILGVAGSEEKTEARMTLATDSFVDHKSNAADVGAKELQVFWAADGVMDIKPYIMERLVPTEAQDIQDMWIEPCYNWEDDGWMIDMFSSEPIYEPLNFVTLHVGAIFSIDQKTEKITELTVPTRRRPFLHSIFRQEVDNMRGNTWPSIVFPERPNTVYRLPTMPDLLAWLSGSPVAFKAFRLPSPVTKLVTGDNHRGERCFAQTEDGKVYHWNRDSPHGRAHTATITQTLQFEPEKLVDTSSRQSTASEVTPQLIPFPTPIKKLVTGITIGAAISTDNNLYVFLMCNLKGTHISDLNVQNIENLYTSVPPLVPHLAVIPPSTTHSHPDLSHITSHQASPSSKTVDVAVGYDHIVALTDTGEVWTVGNGMYGQLGIGPKQFDLYVESHHEQDPEEEHEFAEEWQKVEIEAEELARMDDSERGGKVVAVGAGAFSTLLVWG